MTRPFFAWIALVPALLLLDASLTFANVWPTLAVRWTGQLSVELAMLVLALAAWRRFSALRAVPGLGWLSAFWLLLVAGRYADVTAPALYGRDVNLYWDLRFLPDVAAMVSIVAPRWQLMLGVAAVGVAAVGFFAAIRWALGRLCEALEIRGARRLLAVVSIAVVAGFAVQEGRARESWDVTRTWFPLPVTVAFARQVGLALAAMTTLRVLPPSPPMNTDLGLVKDADVYLVFVESYGAVSWEQPDFAGALRSSRAELEDDMHATGRQVVSAYVESPTFGGNSWLAHISLLSGIEVRDPHTNAQLMSEQRETLATLFARSGHRTIAMMPGLQRPWPEGRFYGFDVTYTTAQVRYPGPDFGWFAIPDQVSLAWLDERELDRSPRPPIFLFFPTLSTHFPFSPRPPYQREWGRLLTEQKYDGADIERAYEEELDWVDFGPAYTNAVRYIYQTIGGYLRLRPDRDFVMLLIGDHQPPAAVSGMGAPWDVPVHVVASRDILLERLRERGFRSGLAPARPPIGKTNDLLSVLVDAFGDRR